MSSAGRRNGARPLFAFFGTTPIRPDSTGFLLSRAERNVAFGDWEGLETAIPLPREVAASREQGIVAAPAALCWSRWEEAVAVATWKGGELRLDTARKTAAYRRPEKDAWAWNDQELQESYTFPKGQTRLVVVYLKSYRDFRDAGLPSVRVELLGPGPDQRRTLVTEAPHCGVFPSPNGEFVALRYAVLGKGADNAVRDRILVVNRQAEVVAEFDAGK